MCLTPAHFQHPIQLSVCLFSGSGPLCSSSAHLIIPLPDGLGVMNLGLGTSEEAVDRQPAQSKSQDPRMPLRIPPRPQIARPHVGVVLDPRHCPATLLHLGLGPEQAVPAFLIAPPLLGGPLGPGAHTLSGGQE